MIRPYAPAPGSVAFRALAHLQQQPAGAELSSAALAEAMGVASNGLGACLQPLVDHRQVFKRQKGGNARSPSFWSLTEHENATRPKPRPSLSDLAAQATARHQVAPAPSAHPRETSALRIALWSDGTLQIQRAADDVLLFSVEEARQLVAYLERMAET